MDDYASSALKMYESVIDDVINEMRIIFLDEGFDEQILQKLKMLWLSKLMLSRTVDPIQETQLPNNFEYIINNDIYNNELAHNIQQDLSVSAPGHSTMQSGYLIPIQIALPTSNSTTDGMTFNVPIDTMNKMHSLLPGQFLSTMNLPDTFPTLIQQHINSNLDENQESLGNSGLYREEEHLFKLGLDGQDDSLDENEEVVLETGKGDMQGKFNFKVYTVAHIY